MNVGSCLVDRVIILVAPGDRAVGAGNSALQIQTVDQIRTGSQQCSVLQLCDRHEGVVGHRVPGAEQVGVPRVTQVEERLGKEPTVP